MRVLPPLISSPKPLSQFEFIALVSLLTALTAASLDTILPALDDIGRAFGLTAPQATQLLITLFVAGLVFGELVFGPIADALGRRPAILLGLGIYGLGTLVSLFADSFAWVLAGRVIQGFGASGPRIATRALIRDCFEGDAMARIMSFIMMVFILVPMLAPAMGQALLALGSWRGIFALFLALALVMFLWFGLRQAETLPADKRIALSPGHLLTNARFILTNWEVMRHTIVTGFLFAGLLHYLSTAQAMFDDAYQAGNLFALYFAYLAFWIGLASFLNGKLVMRFGMRHMSHYALKAMVGFSIVLLVVSAFFDGVPPLPAFLLLFGAVFFSFGLLFGNLNALALQPVGHMAGLASSLNASISSAIAVLVATLMGQLYNATIYPITATYLMAGLIGMVLVARSKA